MLTFARARSGGNLQFTRPANLDDALEALADDPGATLLAGGTDVMVEANFGHRRPDHVIGLRRLEELQRIEAGAIGSGVTYRTLERSEWAALAALSRTVGSPQIRSAGTIGGNLGTASPAGDALPWIAARDARIELRSRGNVRTVPWHDFLTGVKRTSLQPGELITRVLLDGTPPVREAFAKVGVRSAMVISTVSACVMRWEDGRIAIALGSVAPTVVRAREAEAMISAEPAPTDAALEEFGNRVSSAISPITDHRSTAEYRRHAAAVLARRLLERVL